VYGGYGGYNVYVSKCTTSTCTTSGWYDYGSQTYKRSLGFTAYPGMGAEVATWLNGTGFNTSLYIAYSAYGTYDIKVAQMNTSDTKTHTSSMPDNYPSYKAYGEIGIRAVPAAFPIATTYLWLAWRDVYSFTIYKSVVQKYDDDDDSDTWFTRSIDSFKNSYYGARYWKGYNNNINDVTMVYANAENDIRYEIQYGLY